MRKIFFLFILVVATTESFAQGGWVLRESGTSKRLRSISSADGQNSVAVGDSGTIVTSDNAGEKWQVQKPLKWIPSVPYGPMNVNSVVAIGPKIFCSVGSKDTIFRSIDGGISWMGIRSNGRGACFSVSILLSFTELRAISFDSSNGICVAVGGGGEAIFSADSGKKWEENLLNTKFIFASVLSLKGQIITCTDRLNVGYVFLTSDLGNTWAGNWVQRNVSLHGCDIQGWTTVGDSGTVYHSLDKGLNWFPILSATTTNLNAVHFADNANGYIAGDGGLVLYTSDGGSSWVRQHTPTTENLRSVHFTDPFHGFICGDNGVILTTINGGFSPEAVGATPISGYSVKAYPNPFSTTTNIEVSLPRRSDIRISIYNTLGEEVKVVAAGDYDAGKLAFRWDASDLANGNYICNLLANGLVFSTHLNILK